MRNSSNDVMIESKQKSSDSTKLSVVKPLTLISLTLSFSLSLSLSFSLSRSRSLALSLSHSWQFIRCIKLLARISQGNWDISFPYR